MELKDFFNNEYLDRFKIYDIIYSNNKLYIYSTYKVKQDIIVTGDDIPEVLVIDSNNNIDTKFFLDKELYEETKEGVSLLGKKRK